MESKPIRIGVFDVDVEQLENGNYNAYICRAGSSGSNYQNVTAEEIGRYLAEDIDLFSEEVMIRKREIK